MGERVLSNHTNLFAGSPLNRLSWLRTSHRFLNAIIASPATRWLVFLSGLPLVRLKPDFPRMPVIAYLPTIDLKPFLGPEPFFGQGKQEGEIVAVESSEDPHSPTLAARHNSPIVFLGLHENSTSNALPSSAFTGPEVTIANLDGTPYFAIDVAELGLSPERLKKMVDATSFAQNGETLEWSDSKVLMTGLDIFSGAVYAEARSLVDWNYRNKFCPACGSRTYSMWGGWKIACSSLLPWADNTLRKPCPSGTGLHNFTHPRTDPVVIMIAIDETGDKILLGRGKKFPGKFYSALAGFIEPGESFEDAVAREMWEEAGIAVWDIRYHSGQPWPYPASLMVGFYSRADASQPIRIDLDNELVDARWFTRSEIASVLEHQDRLFNSAGRQKTKDTNQRSSSAGENTTPKPEAPPFKLPPTTAIAGVLIKEWVDGKIGFSPISVRKGSL